RFASQPLDAQLLIAGASTVRLRVSGPASGAVLFAKLYDVGPDGVRTLPGSAVSPLRIPRLPAEVTVTLPGIVRPIEAGHRVELDDLSFRVERGQVLGLLGPNGAGKTTTLRMLMGLVHPTGGTMRVFGHRVHPGAPVLSRIGSFVEGPGFLPHLSGKANLALY